MEDLIVTEGPSVESTETAPETESVDTSTDEGVETSSSEDQKADSPAYTPNFKFKYMDKEHEIDPLLRPSIKDKESEEKIRDFATKAMGLDFFKSKHEKTNQEYTQYKTQNDPIITRFNTADSMLKKGDYDSLFEFIGIPIQAIYQFAVQKAQEANLPQDQQMQIQNQRQTARQKDYLESQNQNLVEMQHRQLSEFRRQEMDWVLARPDVHNVVSVFEAKNGPGTFKELVIEKGMAHYARTNGREDLTAQQAVEKVLKDIGGFITPSQGVTTQAPGQTSGLIQQDKAPPIIPNVQGKGTSPVKKKISSIADLKRLAQEVRN